MKLTGLDKQHIRQTVESEGWRIIGQRLGEMAAHFAEELIHAEELDAITRLQERVKTLRGVLRVPEDLIQIIDEQEKEEKRRSR